MNLKYLIAKDKVKKIEDFRLNEVLNFSKLIALILFTYAIFSTFPQTVQMEDFLNLMSALLVCLGLLLAYSVERLMNPIKTK